MDFYHRSEIFLGGFFYFIISQAYSRSNSLAEAKGEGTTTAGQDRWPCQRRIGWSLKKNSVEVLPSLTPKEHHVASGPTVACIELQNHLANNMVEGRKSGEQRVGK